MTSLRRIVSVVAALSAPLVFSAPASNSSDTANADDAAWQAVADKGGERPIDWPADAAKADAVRASTIAAYVDDADALKKFYTAHAGHAMAAEAKRKEALALVYAMFIGDVNHKGRCMALVGQVRRDKSLSSAEREDVAAGFDFLGAIDPKQSIDAQAAALEGVARALQTEFPDVPVVYESLIGIAESSPDDRAAAIASDVLKMDAPDTSKTQAQQLLRRLALKGRTVLAIAQGVLADTDPIIQRGSVSTVVYSWSAAVPATLTQAKAIAAKVPATTHLIGVCTDMGDVAQLQTGGVGLPGDQVYDSMGFLGRFAGRLEMHAPGLVYITDPKGVIISVSAQRDLDAALKALNQ